MPKYFWRFAQQKDGCFRIEVEDTTGYENEYIPSTKYEDRGIYEGIFDASSPYFVFRHVSTVFANKCVGDGVFEVMILPNNRMWCVKKLNVYEKHNLAFIEELERDGLIDATDLWYPETEAYRPTPPVKTKTFVIVGIAPNEVFKKAINRMGETKDA